MKRTLELTNLDGSKHPYVTPQAIWGCRIENAHTVIDVARRVIDSQGDRTITEPIEVKETPEQILDMINKLDVIVPLPTCLLHAAENERRNNHE